MGGRWTACLLALLLSSACSQMELSPEPPVGEQVSPIFNFEQISWRPILDAEGWRNARPEDVLADDPCECEAYSCKESWVADNFGCDVCVALSCDGAASHVCHACE